MKQALADFLALLQHFGTYRRLRSQDEAKTTIILLGRCARWPALLVCSLILGGLSEIESAAIRWYRSRRCLWRKLRVWFRFRHLPLVVGQEAFGRIGSHVLGFQSSAAASSQRQLVRVFSKLWLRQSKWLCFRFWHRLVWLIFLVLEELCFKICLLHYVLDDWPSVVLRWCTSGIDLLTRWSKVALQRL